MPNAASNIMQATPPVNPAAQYYQQNYPYGNTSSGAFNAYAGQAGPNASPEGFSQFLLNSGLYEDSQKLNEYYAGGGQFHPGLFDELGLVNSMGFTTDRPRPSSPGGVSPGGEDPFLAFLMNQMGIAGLGPQAAPQADRFGRQAPQQAPPPPSLMQTTLGNTANVDPLLALLLGAFQS